MCKLLITTQHDGSKLMATITEAWKYFHGSGEKDGFGAAYISRHGKLCWMRSRNPAITDALPEFLEGFCTRSHKKMPPSDGGFLLIHGRKATCGVCEENTHPMISPAGNALIHNGIVHSKAYANNRTTCDSELLLTAMEDKGPKALADISGYFAFGMLEKGQGGYSLHVAKDDVAGLYGAQCGAGWTFGTTQIAVAILTDSPAAAMKENTLVTFDPLGTYITQTFTKARQAPTLPNFLSPTIPTRSYGSEQEFEDTYQQYFQRTS